MKFILETKLKDLGVGVKKVGLKNFEEWCLDNKEECLNGICSGREYWKETNQGIIVDGWVNLRNKQLKQIPFKFYRIENGSFHIDNNLLTSLVGSPEYVGINFYAYNNKLQNLVGGPKGIEKIYDVSHNQINSLEGAPIVVGRNFLISNQQIPPGKQWTIEEIRKKIIIKGVVIV